MCICFQRNICETKYKFFLINSETYRPIGALLTSMLPRTTFEINVNSVDDVEEILHNRDFLVHSSW